MTVIRRSTNRTRQCERGSDRGIARRLRGCGRQLLRASIYVWAPYVLTDVAGETVTAWGIFEIRLLWAEDWKLDGALISRIGGAAVEPADPSGNPTPSEKQDILSRTPADPGEITDSADQQWFEYANAPR